MQQLSDAQIIRRQLGIVFAILAVVGLAYAGWRWGEENGWGNADRAMAFQLEKANQAFLNRNLEMAIARYKRVISKYPRHAQISQAWTQLAAAYEGHGDLPKAEEAYRKFLAEMDPSKADLKAHVMLQIGRLRRLMGAAEGAKQVFEAVRAFRPGSDWAGEALLETGKLRQDQKEWDLAIAIYRQIIKELPGGFLAAEAQSAIGACLEAQGKDGEAMRAYQLVLDKYPVAVSDEAKARLEALKKKKHFAKKN